MNENVMIYNGNKYYIYHSLFVTKSGEVYNAKMRRLVPKDGSIWFVMSADRRYADDTVKRTKYKVNRIVYEAVSGETIDNKHRVINIDGNPENYSFENLKVVAISDIPIAYDYTKYYKISAEDREIIKNDKLSSPHELAEKYNVTVATINKIRSGCVGRRWHEARIKNVENEEAKRKTS